MDYSMEELMLAQARGLLILAYAHKAQANTALYLHYLNRTQEILNAVQKFRQRYEQIAA